MSDLASRLEGYARAALDPAPDELARGRQEALAAYVGVAPALAAAAADRLRPAGRRAAPRTRLALALGVLVLLAVGAGAVAASGAGGPLYGARLDVEALTLPNPGSSAWVPAQVSRLDARISEVEQAASAANPQAVAAAASAYESILAATISAAGGRTGESDVPPGLLRALDRHEQLLSTIAASAPPVARGHVRSALDELRSAIAADAGGHGSNRPTTNPAGNGHPGSAPGQGNGNAGGQPTGTSHPKQNGDHGSAAATPTPTPSPAAFEVPLPWSGASLEVARMHVAGTASPGRVGTAEEALARTERTTARHVRTAPSFRMALAGHLRADRRHTR